MNIRNIFDNCESTTSTCVNVEYTTRTHSILYSFGRKTSLPDNEFCLVNGCQLAKMKKSIPDMSLP